MTTNKAQLTVQTFIPIYQISRLPGLLSEADVIPHAIGLANAMMDTFPHYKTATDDTGNIGMLIVRISAKLADNRELGISVFADNVALYTLYTSGEDVPQMSEIFAW
jgi:D-serine dehydratase